MILEAVAAPLTGGMQILKVGKMVSLVGADEETFKRVPWIAPAWYGITAEVSWSIWVCHAICFDSTCCEWKQINKSLIKKGLPPHLLSPSFLTGIRQANPYLEHLGTSWNLWDFPGNLSRSHGHMVRCRGAKVEPLIALSAPRIVRCGDFGHETVVKILTNMLCAVQDCAMGEVMMIAKKCGVDLKLLLILIQMPLLHISSHQTWDE